ncbi:MAG: ABC transporter permease [Bacteroidota bacterium]
MFKNLLLVALRGLRRQPGYAAINVGGLGLGLACCFLIVLFIQHERSFDTYHANADRAYLLTVQIPSFEDTRFITPSGLGPMMETDVAGVEHVVRFWERREAPVRVPSGDIHTVDPVLLADPGIVDLFSFQVLRGDFATALADPGSAVLTETTARTLFGNTEAVGQTVTMTRDSLTLTVSAVIADLPGNTHLDVGMLVPFQNMAEIIGPEALTSMSEWSHLSYVLLRENADPEAVASGAAEIVTRAHEYGPDETVTAQMRPLPTLRFDTEIANRDLFGTRDPRMLWMFAVVAALILLVACVNFTNLATARATERAREVGVRKSLGSERWQLVAQFLGESLLLSLFAIVLGFVGVVIALPIFNDALGGTTALGLGQPMTLLGLGAIGLVAGLVAGSYPAFYLTRFSPARVLKGDLSTSGGAPTLRRGLVVFQFAVSAFLLVATLTVVDQLRFMRSQDLGFAQEQVVTFPMTPEITDGFEAFKQSLASDPSIVGVAMANGFPGEVNSGSNFLWPGSGTGDESSRTSQLLAADPDYLTTVGLELIDGRWFRDSEVDRGSAYVLNETAVREMGLSDPVGHTFRSWDREPGVVVGVVEDFHFESLQQAIEPLVMAYWPEWMGSVAVRLASGDAAAGLAHVQRTFEQTSPGYTFDYRFVDDAFEAAYRDEARLSTLLGFFAGVAVFIACLGIFGLAALVAQRRRKEIGVRKVLGASVQSLAAMLAGDFVKLVAVAFVVATPLAYLAMSRWLEGFAYAVGLGPGVFAVAGAAVLLVSLLTVSAQAFRAATADPIRALRSE